MKKILAIALAIVLLFGCFPAYAYNIPKVKNVTKAEDKIEALKQKDIIIGYEDGSLGLERYIKRSELTKVLVHAVGEEKVAEALKGKMDLFTDVARTHWANGYIAYAKNYPNPINKLPFVNGYPDGSFRPENNITNAEMLKILVVLAKRDLTENMVKNAKWPSDWVEWAKNEKIIGKDVGLDDLALNEPAIREDSFVALYNSFVQLEKTGPLKEETKKEPVKITPSKKPSSGTGGHVKPTPTPTPTPTPKPPAKDPNKALKDAVSNFIDTIDLETIEKVADPKGKAIYNIPPKAEGLKTLKDNIKRAKELIGKKRLTDDEVKELEALKPVKHEKKDKLINGLANDISHGFVVNWEVQGPRTVKNKDDSRHYTELTDDQIIVKSNAVELKDGTYKAYINYVTKDQYTAGGTIDTVSGATPKYKKQELDSKFYTVEKTTDGFIFKMNVNEPGYQELMKNTSILKPIIKVPVADRVKIENGDLVFVKEQVPTPGTTDATENPAVAPTDKTKVVDIKNITEEEKTEAKNAIVAENPKATEVVINADGSATLKYADGSENTLAKDEIFEAAPVVDKVTLTVTGDNITTDPVAGKVDKGTEVTVTLAPPTDMEVDTFTVGGVDKKADLANHVYTFTINEDTEVAVTYKKVQVTLTVTGDNITTDPVPGLVDKGTEVMVTLAPAADMEVDTFTVGGVDKKADLANHAYTFTMNEDTEVAVTYKKVQVTLTVTGDNITTDPVPGLVDKGTEVTVTLAPPADMEVDTFTVGGVDKKAELIDNVYKFTINEDTEVAVTYKAKEFDNNNITAMEITTPPTKVEYFDGQDPDNTGMIVTLKDNKGMTKEVPADQFSVNDISTALNVDDQQLVASKGNLKAKREVTIYRVFVNFKFECDYDTTTDPQCEAPHFYTAKYLKKVNETVNFDTNAPISVDDLEIKAKEKAPAGKKFDGWKIEGSDTIYTTAKIKDFVVQKDDETSTDTKPLVPVTQYGDTYYNLNIVPVYINKVFDPASIQSIEFIAPTGTPTYNEGDTFQPEGVKVKLTDTNGLTKEVAYADFVKNNLELKVNNDPVDPALTLTPAHNKLIASLTDTTPNVTPAEMDITVSPKPAGIPAPAVTEWTLGVFQPQGSWTTSYKMDMAFNKVKPWIQAVAKSGTKAKAKIVYNGQDYPLIVRPDRKDYLNHMTDSFTAAGKPLNQMLFPNEITDKATSQTVNLTKKVFQIVVEGEGIETAIYEIDGPSGTVKKIEPVAPPTPTPTHNAPLFQSDTGWPKDYVKVETDDNSLDWYKALYAQKGTVTGSVTGPFDYSATDNLDKGYYVKDIEGFGDGDNMLRIKGMSVGEVITVSVPDWPDVLIEVVDDGWGSPVLKVSK